VTSDVDTHVESIVWPTRRRAAATLIEAMGRVTGQPPRLSTVCVAVKQRSRPRPNAACSNDVDVVAAPSQDRNDDAPQRVRRLVLEQVLERETGCCSCARPVSGR